MLWIQLLWGGLTYSLIFYDHTTLELKVGILKYVQDFELCKWEFWVILTTLKFWHLILTTLFWFYWQATCVCSLGQLEKLREHEKIIPSRKLLFTFTIILFNFQETRSRRRKKIENLAATDQKPVFASYSAVVYSLE